MIFHTQDGAQRRRQHPLHLPISFLQHPIITICIFLIFNFGFQKKTLTLSFQYGCLMAARVKTIQH